MAAEQNIRQGIWLMIATSLVFAAQDGLSRHLAGAYNVWMVVMVRFWFFGLFVIAVSMRSPGGLRQAVRSAKPKIQMFRGLILALEICVMVTGFVVLGLIESHAVFATYPLLVAALSGPVLGEKVGWRRWLAICVGFLGVLIILEPGIGVFSPAALIPLAASLMFALYGLLTRYVARTDPSNVSFFYTGIMGSIVMTALGIWHWEWMSPPDWALMRARCCAAALSHWLLIRAYEVAEASAIQPFAFLQLVFASIIAILIFDETIRPNVAIGTAIVVGAGLFTLWRQHVNARKARREAARAG